MTINTKFHIFPSNFKLIALAMLVTCIFSTVLIQAGLYRWVDENGVVHFGDRIPAKYAKIEREEFSSQGLVINVLPAEKTKEQLVAEELQRQFVLEQERLAKLADLRNKTLLSSYVAVSDIERARDDKLAQIKTQIQLLDLNLENLSQQQKSLTIRTSIVEKGSAPDKDEILIRFKQQGINNVIAQKDLSVKREALEAETYNITAFYAKEAADFTLLKMQKQAKNDAANQ